MDVGTIFIVRQMDGWMYEQMNAWIDSGEHFGWDTDQIMGTVFGGGGL